ncbi:hypothetical protein GM418_14485 [Maribellus comscasis]|uniref:Type I restriction enzyme R protein N-terminal domain-containing protein n=1 Tax=Maribellus comscasis TaxID=2681766 RepID=A0A6I6JUS6_9BACT|nr:type I restriction enzyme HsdR N-terminal domain-containing protein [Maribellus comscasis]QGY44830.1 hypothetical protein GM418_14485 [Maribellus comscasis]
MINGKYYSEDFLGILKDKQFSSEDELRDYLEDQLPKKLNISASLIVKEQTLTAGGGGYFSERADLVILNQNRDPIVIIELKKKLTDGSSKTAAIRQLKNYCQRAGVAYGIVLAPNYCRIFQFHGERATSEENYLPELSTIKRPEEKDINAIKGELEKVNRKLDTISRREIERASLPSGGHINHARRNQEKPPSTSNFWVWIGFATIGFLIVVYSLGYSKLGDKGGESNTNEKTATTCNIKGNISKDGKKIYHTPDSPWYAKTVISTSFGERWFCTEQEAENAGFRKWQSR